MKVTFDFSQQKISLEGDEPQLVELLALVREIAPAMSHIQIVTRGHSASQPSHDEGAAKNGGGRSAQELTGQTLKQFIKTISLDNASERIAAVLYYLKRTEGKDSLAPKEVAEYFSICGLQKPTQMPVAIFDAKRNYGYVESAGHGKWKITTQGENLMVGKLNAAEEAAEAK